MSLKVYGQIRGIIRRHHHEDVDHPVFVCVLDELSFHLMLPISKTLPKLHILNNNCTNHIPTVLSHLPRFHVCIQKALGDEDVKSPFQN
jgi:hypothetical protein